MNKLSLNSASDFNGGAILIILSGRKTFVRVLIFLLLLPVASHAARVWLYEGVYIEDVTVFANDNGYTVMLVKMKGHETNGTCSSANAGYIFLNTSGTFNGNWQMVYSTILSAQAQQQPVDFLVDDNTCHTSSGYAGYPDGMGMKFKGVRINGPDN